VPAAVSHGLGTEASAGTGVRGSSAEAASPRRPTAANAGKEGGFLGFGAERVSAGEQQMLDQVRAARDDLNGPGSGDRVLTRFG
jgi:hypothetical protein